MTTGMKRFTKVCLYTALIMFIIGAIMCGVGWMFGGFRPLNSMAVREITGEFMDIPFVYEVLPNGGKVYHFYSDDEAVWQSNYGDWDRLNNHLGDIGDIDGIDGPAPALGLTADTIQDLYIDMGGCTLYIEESEDEYVRLAMSGDTDKIRYHVEDGNLSIVRKPDWSYWHTGTWHSDDKVYLYLPEGTAFRRIDILFGAGRIESTDLMAKGAFIEIGAGECTIDGLTVEEEAMFSVGAGRIDLDSLSCDIAYIEVGAGEMSIDNAEVATDTDINLGMGGVDISGLIKGYMNVDCDMGTVNLHLLDAEKDHDYDIDCSMGTVNIGSHSYSAMADERFISNGSRSYFDIECSMGTVNITFAK